MRRLPLAAPAAATLAAVSLSIAACSGGAPAQTPAVSPTPASGAAPAPTPMLAPGATTTPLAALPTPSADAPRPLIPDAPPRDDYALARRFFGADATPVPNETLYANERVGFTRRFHGFDLLNERVFAFDATVRLVSPNAVWYFPASAQWDEQALAGAAETFEREILPGVIALIAPGRTLPGRIAIAHGHFPGALGYFSAGDALPSAVRPNSNERVGFYLSLAAPVGGPTHMGTLAHELQHLVHWLADPTESAWAHEGFAELAARSLGHRVAPADAYRRNPGVSLRDWPPLSEDVLPHYAAASLFSSYLAERLGPGAIARIAANPADGVAGAQAALDEAGAGLDFEALFADWAAANAAGGKSPPYGYADAPQPVPARRSLTGPGEIAGEVNQFGAWLLAIDPDEPLDVTFTGAGTAPVLPVAPFSGDSCWWSNRGNSVNSTLTRPLDLTGAVSPTLEFRAWWDIEPLWDHGYVSVSADGGATWEILAPTSSTVGDPYRAAYGPAYTGASGGWRLERADLTPFAGRRVLLRFDYVTDDAVNRPGWGVDDIAAPEIGFFDDAESDGEWTADGFVRACGGSVEQRFALRLVEGRGSEARVWAPRLAGGSASFRVAAPITLVVTAFADKTSERAAFRVRAARAAR